MTSPVLICGSVAFDTIAVFDGRFKEHILPDRIHALSVSFLVPTMRREFGGCAGNIAYNLQLLDGNPLIMATAGEDFAPYTAWLNKHKLNTTHIKTISNSFTAQAFITTDVVYNQNIYQCTCTCTAIAYMHACAHAHARRHGE